VKIYRDRKAPTEYGKGTHIELDGNELAHAINSYLYAMDVYIDGPRTVKIFTSRYDGDGDLGLCGGVKIYVDPSGHVLHDGDEIE